MEELEKAWKYVCDCWESDEEMDRKLNLLNTSPQMDALERDELEWLVEQWNFREGQIFVAEGREWAWKGAGVVKKME